MPNRRQFLRQMASASAGAVLLARGGDPLWGASRAPQAAAKKHAPIMIAGRKIKTVDMHCHVNVPEAKQLIQGTPLEAVPGGTNVPLGAERLEKMDEMGIDIQAVSINAFWYAADRDLATRLIDLQNHKLVEMCAAHPDRFVAFASVALQFPDLAAKQLEDGMKLGLHGAAIGGSVEGEEISLPKYDPFWAKVQELGVLVFMHPNGAENVAKMGAFEGAGDLGNIIGNPLETIMFFSHLVYDGTLDKFPGLKIIGAHGGGYLPSYLGRTDVACDVRANAKCVNKKHPREYLHDQILADSMVFTPEGVRHLVAEMGASQVAYGTDIPLVWPDTIDSILGAWPTAWFWRCRRIGSIVPSRPKSPA